MFSLFLRKESLVFSFAGGGRLLVIQTFGFINPSGSIVKGKEGKMVL